MIPSLAVVKVRGKRRHGFSLWIPLSLLWLLLLPVAVLALPFLVLYCLIGQVSFSCSMQAFWQIFCGLAGTQFEVDHGGHSVFVRIS